MKKYRVNVNGNTYDILGVVSANTEYDVVVLKISDEIGGEVKFGNTNELNTDDKLFMINSKNTMDVKYLEKMIKYIKKITQKYRINDIIILYGGSIDENNIESINGIKDLNGFLIGNSSLDVDKLLKINEVTKYIEKNYLNVTLYKEKAIHFIANRFFFIILTFSLFLLVYMQAFCYELPYGNSDISGLSLLQHQFHILFPQKKSQLCDEYVFFLQIFLHKMHQSQNRKSHILIYHCFSFDSD